MGLTQLKGRLGLTIASATLVSTNTFNANFVLTLAP